MIQLTENIFAVPVPDDVDRIYISGLSWLCGYTKGNKMFAIEQLHSHKYKLLFTTSTIDEEKAKMMVETDGFEEAGDVFEGFVDYGNENRILSTARQSFQSLLQSKGLTGNYAIIEKVTS